MTGFYIRYIYEASRTGYYICVENAFLPNIIAFGDRSRLGISSDLAMIPKKDFLYAPDLNGLKTEWYYSRYCRHMNYFRKCKSIAYINEWVAEIDKINLRPSVGGWVRSSDNSLDLDNFLREFSIDTINVYPKTRRIKIVEKEMIEIDNIWKPKDLILLKDIT